MTAILIEIWEDLRQKRLWPVAAALLVALVAVPVALTKSGEDLQPPPAHSGQKASAQAPLLPGAETDAPGSSDLGVFDPKNPFRGPRAHDTSVTADLAGGDTSSASAPADPASGGATAGTAPGTDPASASGGPAAGPVGGGGGGPTPARERGSSGGQATLYTYVADLEFGTRGEERLRRGVKRLALLPSDRKPLLVFLGVTADEKRAVFLVDSSLRSSGEGTCRPTKRECSFLYLGTSARNNQQFFVDEDANEYGLRLLRMRRIPLREARRAARSASRRRAPARRRQGGWGAFSFPLFADAQR